MIWFEFISAKKLNNDHFGANFDTVGLLKNNIAILCSGLTDICSIFRENSEVKVPIRKMTFRWLIRSSHRKKLAQNCDPCRCVFCTPLCCTVRVTGRCSNSSLYSTTVSFLWLIGVGLGGGMRKRSSEHFRFEQRRELLRLCIVWLKSGGNDVGLDAVRFLTSWAFTITSK